jgi:hypothetical protein
MLPSGVTLSTAIVPLEGYPLMRVLMGVWIKTEVEPPNRWL